MTSTEFLDAGGAISPAQGGGYNATDANKLHGHGPTPEDAILNIGATIIPYNGRRQLHRTNGEIIELDPSLVPKEPEPAPESVEAAPVVEADPEPDAAPPVVTPPAAKKHAAKKAPKKRSAK